MSSLDWIQIVAGSRYCIRRAITWVASIVAFMITCPRESETLVAVDVESTE